MSALGSTDLEDLPFERQGLHFAWIKYDTVSLPNLMQQSVEVFEIPPIETDIQLKGKHRSRHLKFDRGMFLVGMKGKAESMQFPFSPTGTSAKSSGEMTSSVASWH